MAAGARQEELWAALTCVHSGSLLQENGWDMGSICSFLLLIFRLTHEQL